MNRSIAESSLLYYLLHIIYPVICKLPLIGRYMTHVGFVVSVVVALFCVYLTYTLIFEVQDICLVSFNLYVINWGLTKAMYGHLKNVLLKRKAD